MFAFEEELLEPVARYFRFNEVMGLIDRTRPVTVADLGCGPKMRAYYAMQKRGVHIARYMGIDPLLSPQVVKKYARNKAITLVPSPFAKRIPLDSKSVDYIISFAVLEHIDHPKEILNDMVRVLRPGGKAFLTTPTPRAKAILEFMSYKLGIISPREIQEHKNYFTKEMLKGYVEGRNDMLFSHHYFEFGLNNAVVITKT